MELAVRKRGAICITAIVALLALLAGLVPAQAQLSKGKGDLRVMTYNAYEGTAFLDIQRASNLNEFLFAVGKTITQVRATNPPSRMQAVARQIVSAKPALVSVQELDQWSSGPFDPIAQKCGTLTPEFDMVQELLDALAAQGGSYDVAVQGQQYDIEAPGLISPNTFLCIHAVNHVAILARTDLDRSKFYWNNAQAGQYVARNVFDIPDVGQFPAPRAWVSLDAQFHNKTFRFIGTHLDSDNATVRGQQGEELRLGPANTSLPVVIAMDSNARAAPPPQDATYIDFITAGYSDVWSEIFPGKSGFTCCQAQLVNNPVSQLSRRIDLILTLGNVGAQNIALFGADQASRTLDGLWPSDHTGVAAQLVIEAAE
jgi:endonuclease/exonuclease/phosphatase family metal-dependent hydrolase